MIISLAFGKGGVGKSTLAHCLAYSKAFQRKFKTIALVDMDPQGTLSGYYRDRQGPAPDHVTFAQVLDEKPAAKLKALASGHGAVIMDVPGRQGFAIRFAVLSSDLVIVPCRSSNNDEDALASTLWPFLQEHKSADLQTKVLPVMTHPQSRAETHSTYFRSILPPTLDVFPVTFPYRPNVYEHYNRGGLTLMEYAESVKSNQRFHAQAQKAITDIEAIAKEITRHAST